MRRDQPFLADDLADLAELFETAHAVVAMRDLHAGNRRQDVIGVRHDVDDNPGSFDAAVHMARWEASHGWRSSYYLLHTASYWGTTRFRQGCETIALAGHEIGIHADALAYAVENGGDPALILDQAISELREWGHAITGVVGHGNPLCPLLGFANDEQFVECARSQYGDHDRAISYGGRTLRIDPRPLADFGLEYEAVRARGSVFAYNTDSGGAWWRPWQETVDEFLADDKQLSLLIHPDWWTQAFTLQAVAA